MARKGGGGGGAYIISPWNFVGIPILWAVQRVARCNAIVLCLANFYCCFRWKCRPRKARAGNRTVEARALVPQHAVKTQHLGKAFCMQDHVLPSYPTQNGCAPRMVTLWNSQSGSFGKERRSSNPWPRYWMCNECGQQPVASSFKEPPIVFGCFGMGVHRPQNDHMQKCLFCMLP